MDSDLVFFLRPGFSCISLRVDCISEGVDKADDGCDKGVSNVDLDQRTGTGGGLEVILVGPSVVGVREGLSCNVVGLAGLFQMFINIPLNDIM